MLRYSVIFLWKEQNFPRASKTSIISVLEYITFAHLFKDYKAAEPVFYAVMESTTSSPTFTELRNILLEMPPSATRPQPADESPSEHPLYIPDYVAVLIVTRSFVCKYCIPPGAGVFDDTDSSPARLYGLKLAKSIAAHFKDLEGVPHIGEKTWAECYDNRVFRTVLNLMHREEGWSNDEDHFWMNSFHIVKAPLEGMIQWAGRTPRQGTMTESESGESEEQSVQDDG